MAQSFRSPKSKVWTNVTLLAPFSNGSSKRIQCNSCEAVFAGNAGRVRAHYSKCLAVPENLRSWALAEVQLKQEIHSTKVEAKLLDWLMDFIYLGEANIFQEQVESFLALADRGVRYGSF